MVKPHIYFHNGYWRVTLTPFKRSAALLDLYVKANTFTVKLNGRILIGQRQQYRKRHEQ